MEGAPSLATAVDRLKAYFATFPAPEPQPWASGLPPTVSAGAEVILDQPSLFGAEELPVPASKEPVQTIYVHFERLEDIKAFGELLGLTLNTQTRRIEYPPHEALVKR